MTKFNIIGKMLGSSIESHICTVESETSANALMAVLRRMPAGIGRRGQRINKYDYVYKYACEQPDAATASSSHPAF
jgi:hypothetical protein